MNDVTLFGGDSKISLTGADAMAKALKQSANAGSGGTLPEGGVYISFSGKMGKYSIGEEKEDASADEYWLVGIHAFERGWICWKGGSPAARRMASIYDEPIPTPDMTEHGPFDSSRGEGWYQAKQIVLRSLDSGVQGHFATNTKSALREFSKLEGEVARRLEEGEPAWPVINLLKEEFTAQGQRNWKPKFDIVGWIGDKQITAMTEMDDIAEIADSIDDLIAEAKEEVTAKVPDDEPKPRRRRRL